ncbi:MAG: hypothetical protein ACO3I0_00655 [Limisphaerales bacterium]
MSLSSSSKTLLLLLMLGLRLEADTWPRIPEVLRPWVPWATWSDAHRNCPTPYSDPKTHRCFWPSTLELEVTGDGARFTLDVLVYDETWVPLPGGGDVWPVAVEDSSATAGDGKPAGVAVLEHDKVPAVRLVPGGHRMAGEPGRHRLTGMFRWSRMPQRLRIPPEIGVLNLTLLGQPVPNPAWDADGQLWLKRDGAAGTDEKNFLATKVYSLVEDGIPMWLRQEVELTVSGKSREESLGAVVPEGWRLSSVVSPIPVAVDDQGRLKAQVRPGKWKVQLVSFRTDNPKSWQYPSGVAAATPDQWVGFASRPELRVVEIIDSPSVDVSQTTFPEAWRKFPVYRWDVTKPFRLVERMRGMGDQKPPGLTIAREWWLDEDGGGLTFRDRVQGAMQQVWRLDVAEGEDLGSVRIGGQGQLVTLNPKTGAAGVEVRTRNLDLEATGRLGRQTRFPATGWRSDAESLRVTLHLPPGWRLLALFGADWVRGDWLTAWTLLDVFLLLIFTLTVFRMWGWGPAVLAFLAYGLSFHEPGAPRYTWLLLLVPLALERVVRSGAFHRIIQLAKWGTILTLVFLLTPFIGRQVQQAIYPQLEWLGRDGRNFQPAPALAPLAESQPPPPAQPAQEALAASADAPRGEGAGFYRMDPVLARRYGMVPKAGASSVASLGNRVMANLLYEAEARIQTGPGVPEWTWRAVSFGWNGPVQAAQQVRPVLIPVALERLLTVLRVGLILGLAAVLLRHRRAAATTASGVAPRLAVLALLLGASLGHGPRVEAAEAPIASVIPDATLLEKLRERVLEVPDAFPNAAEIPTVSLRIEGRRLTAEAEIHTALRVAVPLPGRLPVWSPISVRVDGEAGSVLRRDDGFLWVVLPAGVHRVQWEGRVPEASEWEWAFQLKPRRVTVEAPGWAVSGIRDDGVPEQQVLFVSQERSAANATTYERQEVQSVALVVRQVELGLVAQVRTVVTRLTPPGKALALRIPLLPGENVLSANAPVVDGAIEVRVGAQDTTSTWESGLSVSNVLMLSTRPSDIWVEQWELRASPTWNVALSGLVPVFGAAAADLLPVWHPWPGESVRLDLTHPTAVSGATRTVDRVTHEVSLGSRQRTSTLNLSLRSSLGEDFLIELPEGAEVTGLVHAGRVIPVRKEGRKVVVPLRPGEQTVDLSWKVAAELGFRAGSGSVSLPVDSANINTVLKVPDDRWVLWTWGPLRGPAVRFWGILVCSLLAAIALGRLPQSPLRTWQWLLLGLGLTQVPLEAALVVIAWLFLLRWRGMAAFQQLGPWVYNLLQLVVVVMTASALGVLVYAVGEGLLGSPEMFILGNNSSRTVLQWYQDRSGGALPTTAVLSVSIWWYRLLMLFWALWLASALLSWLKWAWRNFSLGGLSRPWRKAKLVPPTL